MGVARSAARRRARLGRTGVGLLSKRGPSQPSMRSPEPPGGAVAQFPPVPVTVGGEPPGEQGASGARIGSGACRRPWRAPGGTRLRRRRAFPFRAELEEKRLLTASSQAERARASSYRFAATAASVSGKVPDAGCLTAPEASPISEARAKTERGGGAGTCCEG